MPMKPLTEEEITIDVYNYAERVPVVGNAMASGDDAVDHVVEQEILRRLSEGDVWAWSTVEVRASWQMLKASSYLGCCCYADESEFRHSSGYYEDMVAEALEELNCQATDLHEALCYRTVV